MTPTGGAPVPDPSIGSVTAALWAAGCVFAEDEARLLVENTGTATDLARAVERRVSGVPLEQVLGFVEFHGLRVAVAAGVFVPRQRTGLLVDVALELLAGRPAGTPAPVVVELCCGSGAVAAALLAAVPPLDVHAVAVDPAAVGCARRNLDGSGAVTYEGDLFTPLPGRLAGSVDLLVANAPYVPTSGIPGMPPEAREHEPVVALDGGADGLDVLHRVVAGAPDWLAPGGHVVVEAGSDQAEQVAGLMMAAGLVARVRSDPGRGATAVSGSTKGRPRVVRTGPSCC